MDAPADKPVPLEIHEGFFSCKLDLELLDLRRLVPRENLGANSVRRQTGTTSHLRASGDGGGKVGGATQEKRGGIHLGNFLILWKP